MKTSGKRANFTSIQLSHHVPCANGEVNRIRTGTESLIAHMCSSKFASAAPFNGVVTEVDEKDQLIEVTPNPMTVKTVGVIDLKRDAKAIDEAAISHKYYRSYVPKGKYALNEIYKLTNKSAGLISAISPNVKREHIPEDVLKRYPRGELDLLTFVLSPIVVTPRPTVFKYGEIYTKSQGTYLKQDLVVNVKKGDKVKKSDVLVYNSGFFTPKTDPFGPGTDLGVDWKHGVMANILLIETASTYEDACAVTRDFGKKLEMFPGHVRPAVITKNSIIHHVASVGDEIYSTDPIMIVQDSDLEILGGTDDPDAVDFNNTLAQQIIRARYHGRVSEVSILYGCPIGELHPSIQKLALAQERKAYRVGKRMGKTGEELNAVSGYVRPGTKYQGTEFTEDTVLFEFTISEALNTGEGDKLCIMTSNKTVVSSVLDQAPVAYDGTIIDLVFSVTSPYKRIVNSPFLNGMGNRILEDAEKQLVDIYFNS